MAFDKYMDRLERMQSQIDALEERMRSLEVSKQQIETTLNHSELGLVRLAKEWSAATAELCREFRSFKAKAAGVMITLGTVGSVLGQLGLWALEKVIK